MLPGFFKDDAIHLSLDDALRAAPLAFRSDNEHNIYLEDEEDEEKASAPETTTSASQGATKRDVLQRAQHSSKTCVTYDQVSPASPLHALYNWDPLLDFLAAVLSKEQLHRTADRLGALNVHIYHQGDELGWHFDRGEFAVSLLLQSSAESGASDEGGGHFEYAPHLRSADDQNYVDVIGVLDAAEEDKSTTSTGGRIRRLNITPGALVFFCGRHSLHRVTKVTGDTPRVMAILSFETRPGVELNDYTRLKFFGRTG